MQLNTKMENEYTVDLRDGSVKVEYYDIIRGYLRVEDIPTLFEYDGDEKINFKFIYPENGVEPRENRVTDQFLVKLNAHMQRVDCIDLKNVAESILKEKFKYISDGEQINVIRMHVDTQITTETASQFTQNLRQLHCVGHEFKQFMGALEMETLSLNTDSIATLPVDLNDIIDFIRQKKDFKSLTLTYTHQTLSHDENNENVSIAEICQKLPQALPHAHIINNSNGEFVEHSASPFWSSFHTNNVNLIQRFNWETLIIGPLSSTFDVYTVAATVKHVKELRKLVLDVDEKTVGLILSENNEPLMKLFPEGIHVIIKTSATNRIEKWNWNNGLNSNLCIDDSIIFVDEIPLDVISLKVNSRGKCDSKKLALNILLLGFLEQLSVQGEFSIVLMEQYNGNSNYLPRLSSLKLQHSEEIVRIVEAKLPVLVGLKDLRFVTITLETNIDLDGSETSLNEAIPVYKKDLWQFRNDKFFNRLIGKSKR